MTGRAAGTVRSSGPDGSTSTCRSASSGRSSSTGSSSRSAQSSTRIRAATAVTGFVIDEMRKMVRSSTARSDGPPAVPAAPVRTSPRRATAQASPTALPRST